MMIYHNSSFYFRAAPDGSQMPPNPLNLDALDDNGLDDMTRQRHVYETAFDCRISKSDDDLEQIDKVSNHPVLMEVSNTWESKPLSEQTVDNNSLNRTNRNRSIFQKNGQDDNSIVFALSQDIKVGHQQNIFLNIFNYLNAISLRVQGVT